MRTEAFGNVIIQKNGKDICWMDRMIGEVMWGKRF